MRTAVRLAVAGAVLLAPAAAPAAPDPGPRPAAGAAKVRAHSVLVDGDSLAVGTAPYLPGDLPGWRVRQSADISRHTPDGVSLLKAYGRHLPHVVVLSLGTNDDPRTASSFRHDIHRALRIVGRHRCIVWPLIHRPPVAGATYHGYNRAIADVARGQKRLRAFNWERMARRHPYWFGSDGVHPDATGYQARARALARHVRRCAAGLR